MSALAADLRTSTTFKPFKQTPAFRPIKLSTEFELLAFFHTDNQFEVTAGVGDFIERKFNDSKLKQAINQYKGINEQRIRELRQAGIPIDKILADAKKYGEKNGKIQGKTSALNIFQFFKYTWGLHVNVNAKHVPMSLMLTALLLFINTACYTMIFKGLMMAFAATAAPAILPMVAPMIAMGLTAVFIAPVAEELMKKVALKMEIGATFAVTFIYGEAAMYLSGLAGAAHGVSLVQMIVARIMAAMMHFYTMFVQTKSAKVDTNTGKAELAPLATAGTTVFHAMWNGLAFAPFFASLPYLIEHSAELTKFLR